MTTTEASKPNCVTCGNSYDFHVTHQARLHHPYNDGSGTTKSAFRGRNHPQRGKAAQDGAERAGDAPTAVPWPFDPVLRQALIDKGLLTPDDLRTAEEKIRAVSAQLLGGSNGEGKVQI
jgi:hypothetical protein